MMGCRSCGSAIVEPITATAAAAAPDAADAASPAPSVRALIRPGKYSIEALLASSTWAFRDARTGRKHLLAHLCAEKPLVLVFLRRLGCQLCRVTAMGYECVRPEIEALGANMVAVTFEALGEGSDADGSFTAGGYWKGPLMKERGL